MTGAYPIEVHWSAEDDAWIADVPDLPYCTAHGPTPHEAVAQIEQAIEAWLDAARADGRPILEPSRRAAPSLTANRDDMSARDDLERHIAQRTASDPGLPA